MLSLEFWFTVAIIILFVEMSALLLIMVALMFGLGFGAEVLRNKLKLWMPLAQGYAGKGANLTKEYTTKAMRPAIAAESAVTRWQTTLKTLLRRQ